jgi:glycosyltransferase involved in cell wall biosynthesis
MQTGGTRDILRADATALLSTNAAEFSRDLRRLAEDGTLRLALGAAARHDVRARFAAPTVVEQVERVYRSLLLPRAA